MRIIGLSGKIGVGKTTIAQYIIELLKGWQIASFADLIKQEAARKYDFDPALAYSKAGKETVIKLSDGSRKTVRELLQHYGTDVVRAGDRDRWVRVMERNLMIARGKIPGVIIDDVRFPNEALMVRRRAGLLVRIEPYPGYIAPSSHISETALDKWRGFMLTLRPEFGAEPLRFAATEIVSAARRHIRLG
jgi:hypothetical protein